MPKLLAVLSIVGTAAMIWVGGHILVAGAYELGWHGPHDLIAWLEKPAHDIASVGGILGWFVDTAASAAVGLLVGFAIVAVMSKVKGKGAPMTQHS